MSFRAARQRRPWTRWCALALGVALAGMVGGCSNLLAQIRTADGTEYIGTIIHETDEIVVLRRVNVRDGAANILMPADPQEGTTLFKNEMTYLHSYDRSALTLAVTGTFVSSAGVGLVAAGSLSALECRGFACIIPVVLAITGGVMAVGGGIPAAIGWEQYKASHRRLVWRPDE